MNNTIRLYLKFLIIGLITILISCNNQESAYIYEGQELKIKQIAKDTYLHISYLETEDFGKVACNGLIVADGGASIVFDTPANDSQSNALINWIEKELQSKVIGVIATHFHVDCLGGLTAFHNYKIPSYANNLTIELARANKRTLPQSGFDDLLELNVGGSQVIAEFVGEGHTSDNIIGYFPKEKVLFGGCLIKSVGAGKGNLEDANTQEWSKTVERLKAKYADAKIIVPGHGTYGNRALLNYTIELFKINKDAINQR